MLILSLKKIKFIFYLMEKIEGLKGHEYFFECF